jgi:N-acetylneuraminic acid mutarotase
MSVVLRTRRRCEGQLVCRYKKEPVGTLGAGSGNWVQLESFPAPASQGIADGSAVAVGQKLYHIGGHIGHPQEGNVLTNATFIYDLLLNSFKVGPTLPMPLARGSVAYDGASTIYYVAGVTTGQEVPGSGNMPNCLFTYDDKNPNTKWVAKPCMALPRSDHCSVWLGGKLYVIGGYVVDGELPSTNKIDVYDPATNSWADAGVQLPKGRGDLACAVLQGHIYVAGGIDTDNWDNPAAQWYTSEVVKVDVAAKTVVAVAKLPGKPRGDLALAAVSDTQMLAMGGEIHGGVVDRTQIATRDVFMYDASTNVWVRHHIPMTFESFAGEAVLSLHAAFSRHGRCMLESFLLRWR